MIKYYPLDFAKPVISVTMALSSDKAQVSEVKEKVKEALVQYAQENGEDPTKCAAPIICISKDKKIEEMAQSKVQLSRIEKGYEFVAIEREQHAAKDIQPVQLIITQQRKNFFFGTSNPNLT